MAEQTYRKKRSLLLDEEWCTRNGLLMLKMSEFINSRTLKIQTDDSVIRSLQSCFIAKNTCNDTFLPAGLPAD